jgi:hypothetical protein
MAVGTETVEFELQVLDTDKRQWQLQVAVVATVSTDDEGNTTITGVDGETLQVSGRLVAE